MIRRFPQHPDYEFLLEIGSGPNGTLYKVLRRRHHELLALKWVAPASPALGAAMQRWFRATSRLDHPGLVRPLSFGETEAAVHFTSEFVDGKDLVAFLAPPIRPDPECVRRTVYLFAQLLRALAYLHGEGIVHRGIRPTNVLVNRQAQVRVTDPDLPCDAAASRATGDLGSLLHQSYQAPEQLLGRSVDQRTDLYAVGLLLHAALAGGLPHRAYSLTAQIQARVEADAPPLDVPDPHVVRAFGPPLERLLARKPADRPASAQDALRELRAAWERLTGTTRAEAAMIGGGKAEGVPGGPPAPAPILGTTEELRLHDIRLAAQEATASAPRLIGRERDLASLEACLGAIASPGNRLIALGGACGVGKSRLLASLAATAAGRGIFVIDGRAARGPSAHPLATLLEGVASRLEQLAPSERDRLRPPHAEFLGTISARFRSLYGEPGEDSARQEIEHRAMWRRAHIRAASLELLRNLAAADPTLVVLEDLHAADPEDMEVLAHLARTFGSHRPELGAPVLFVASYRNDELDPWHPVLGVLNGLAAEGVARTIDIEPLGEPAAAELAAALTGSAPPPELERFLWRSTRGNPLFLEEMLRHLEAEGVLRRSRGSLHVDLELLDHLPEPAPAAAGALRELVRERLRKLPLSDLEVLQSLAVAGGDASLDLLLRATRKPELLLRETLDALARGGLLVEEPARSGRLCLRSALHREAVLDPMAPSTRRAVAARVARALEEQPAHEHAGRVVTLARLCDEAGDSARTIDYLARAAEALANQGNVPGAVRRWLRLLDLLAGLADTQRPVSLELEARAKAASFLALLGELDRARAEYEDLLLRATGSERQADRMNAWNGLARVACLARDPERAQRMATQALAQALSLNHADGQATALEHLGTAERLRGAPSAALKELERALVTRRELRDDLGIMRVLLALGLVLRDRDQLSAAERAFTEARECSGRLRDRQGLALAEAGLGSIKLREHEHGEAREHYLEAERHDVALGCRRGVGLVSHRLGQVYQGAGDHRLALERFERALRIFTHIGERLRAADALTGLGHTHLLMGSWEESARRSSEALGILAEEPDAAREVEARCGLARALDGMGDRARAVQEATRAVEGARDRDLPDKQVEALLVLSRITGSMAQAEEALALARRLSVPRLLLGAHHQLALLSLKAGSRGAASDHFQRACLLIDTLAEKTRRGREAFLRRPEIEAVLRDAGKL